MMNRDHPQKVAVSLRQAPTDRAPSVPAMGNMVWGSSNADTMTDLSRIEGGHAPLQRGQGNTSVTIAQRVEKLETENAGLKERMAAIEDALWPEVPTEATAPQTTPGEIDGTRLVP
jgi:hypothetical protein